VGQRWETTFGVGLQYSPFNVDISYIHSPKTSEARDQQYRVSFMMTF
jgi:hypothetical protein